MASPAIVGLDDDSAGFAWSNEKPSDRFLGWRWDGTTQSCQSAAATPAYAGQRSSEWMVATAYSWKGAQHLDVELSCPHHQD
jgi:hypothetical protein